MILHAHSRRTFWLTFAVLCLILLVLGMDPLMNAFDEGFVLAAAARVAGGAVLYRDIWFLYGPGQIVLLAALFKLFGTAALLGRLVYVASMLAFVSLSALIALIFRARRQHIVVLAVVSIVWVSGVNASVVYPVFPSLALSLLTLLSMALRWKRADARYTVAAGIFAAVLLLFRQDMAAWTTFSLLLAELTFHLTTAASTKSAIKSFGQDCLLYLAGFLPVVGLAWLLYLRHVPLFDLYDQLVAYQAHLYKAYRGLPLPSPWYWGPEYPSAFVTRHHLERLDHFRTLLDLSAIYLPYLALVPAAIALGTAKFRRLLQPWQIAIFLSLLGIVATMPFSGLIRPDPTHQIVGVLPALLLLCILLATRASMPAVAQWALRAVCVATLLFCGVTCLRGIKMIVTNAHAWASPSNPRSIARLCRPVPGLERARCIYIEPDEVSTVLFLKSHTSAGDHIFSSGTRTDKIFSNDASLYFLSGRDASGKWSELEPGVGNTRPVQQELIRDFDRDHVAYIVQDSRNDYQAEPNLSSVSSNIFLLDQYVAANYRPVAVFGKKTILQRSTPFATVRGR